MTLAGYALALLVVIVAVVLVYRVQSKGTAKRLARHFALEPGEGVEKLWVGQVDVTPATVEHLASRTADALVGALLEGIDAASTRLPVVAVLLTDRSRLLLVTERAGGEANRVVFEAPADLAIERLGPGARRIQGGPSEMLELVADEGLPLRLLLHESAGPALLAWAGR